MIHLRIDDEENSKARFACGIVGVSALPDGDKYYFEGEYKYRLITCEGCGGGPHQLGTPIAELSGQPGKPGYEKFMRIAASWGYD